MLQEQKQLNLEEKLQVGIWLLIMCIQQVNKVYQFKKRENAHRQMQISTNNHNNSKEICQDKVQQVQEIRDKVNKYKDWKMMKMRKTFLWKKEVSNYLLISKQSLILLAIIS